MFYPVLYGYEWFYQPVCTRRSKSIANVYNLAVASESLLMKQDFIPGIYNYCDRWCERCTFTARCATYEGSGDLPNDELDSNNNAFWEQISNRLQEAVALLLEGAKARGIDLNALTDEELDKTSEGRSLLRDAAQKTPVSKLCKTYQKTVSPFLKKSEGLVDNTRELADHLHLGIKSEEDVVSTVADTGDCLEIIQWYLFFIHGKIQRALLGKMDDDGFDDEHGFPKDYEGSAKIALISIDKTMAAWIKLYELLPSCEDVALKALSLLEKIKQLTNEEFPEAMQFKRPGFDD
jgi:hypothetical protein